MARQLQLWTLGKAWLKAPSFAINDLPAGWLNEFDARVLYSIAAATRGPLIEIGSWIGRSSCAMAYGLRDMVAAGAKLPRFDILDFGLTGAAEARERLNFDPFWGPHADMHAKSLFYPGGIVGYLKQNLVDRDLARYVNHLVFGPLATYETTVRYEAAFCDTTHTAKEIAENVPKLASMLNPDDFIIAFDDILTPPMAAQIQEIVDADRAALTCGDDPDNKVLVMTKGSYTRLVFPTATPITLSVAAQPAASQPAA